jgi:hypothetical protein
MQQWYQPKVIVATVRSEVTVATICSNNLIKDAADRCGNLVLMKRVEKPRGFSIVCTPRGWHSSLFGRASRWQARGLPLVLKPSEGKGMGTENPRKCVGDEAWRGKGVKPLKQQVLGPQGIILLGKDRVCEAAGVSTPVWSKTGRKFLGLSLVGAGPQRWPSPRV